MVYPPEKAVASCSGQAPYQPPLLQTPCPSTSVRSSGFSLVLSESWRDIGWRGDPPLPFPSLPRFTTRRFLLALAQATLDFNFCAPHSPFPGSRFRKIRKDASRGHKSNLCENPSLSPSPVKAWKCLLCPGSDVSSLLL